jgi:hypothetical protein
VPRWVFELLLPPEAGLPATAPSSLERATVPLAAVSLLFSRRKAMRMFMSRGGPYGAVLVECAITLPGDRWSQRHPTGR